MDLFEIAILDFAEIKPVDIFCQECSESESDQLDIPFVCSNFDNLHHTFT